MAGSGGDEDHDERRSAWVRLSELVSQLESQTFQHTQMQPPNSDPDLDFAEALDDAGGANPVMLTDLDVFDCPICVQPLCSPIYQCENGHIICSSCCVKANTKCPSCCLPIGYIRSRVMEKLVDSLKVECKNKRFGCKEMVIYREKFEHENTCPHTPCFCPLPSCNFAGSSKNLYSHFSTHHSSSVTPFTYHKTFSLCTLTIQNPVILQERNEGVIFILNHESQEHGRVFNVECIGPSTFKNAFVYQLSFSRMVSSLSLEDVPEVCAQWHEHTLAGCYPTIPPRFNGLFLDVCIKKAY